MSQSALNAALSALFANSAGVAQRAGNVANAQTGGYKAVEARLSALAAGAGGAGAGVVATPVATNALSGTILQSASATSIAVTGAGFLPVRESASGSGETLYTRRGDFSPDGEGYLRNGAGQVLYARAVGGAGPLVPVRVERADVPAVPTSAARYAANLPANAPPGTVVNGGSIAIVDAQGVSRSFDIVWHNRTTAGGTLPGVAAGPATGSVAIPPSAVGTVPQWRAVLTATTGSANGAESLALDFSFGVSAGVDAGLPVAVSVQSTDPATLSGAVSGGRVTLGYGSPAASPAPLQTIAVDFGAPAPAAGAPSLLGAAGGMTAFGATSISIAQASADGSAAARFLGAGIDADGQVYTSYSDGRRVAAYQVVLANFANAGGMTAQDGETFRANPGSGDATLSAAARGALAANSAEASNVDLGNELVRTLVAQRAYSASARLVAASDEMLKELTRLRR